MKEHMMQNNRIFYYYLLNDQPFIAYYVFGGCFISNIVIPELDKT
uniref:Uncharacterized protein n=1 Tax=Arundo donax TaxID=35708 RepID=A0A0A9BAZ1_ARUDO